MNGGVVLEVFAVPILDPFPAWHPVLVGAEGRRVGHWENSLQEGGGDSLQCVGVELGIENPLVC